MRLRALLIVALAGVLVAADDPKDVAKKELEKLQGTWTVVSAQRDGKPDEAFKDVEIIVAGNELTRKSKDQAVKATLQLDPARKPKALDLLSTDGPDKGTTYPGIYALDGDSLTISQLVAGKEGPAELAAKPATAQLLVLTLKRKPVVASVFPDKNLEAAVKAVLQHSKGELSDANLANVYVLEAVGKNIQNLAGLEKCKNLALLRLSKNQVTDVTPLKDLTNLQSLDLADNKIADATPLKGLTKLQYLELSNNQVADVEPLGGLTSLSALYLSGNKISDLAPLAKLSKLASLSLGHNQIRTIDALAQVTKLTTLDLKDNQIEDLTPLTKQTEISLLMLERNKISDLAPLVALAKADAEGQKRFAPYLRLYLAGNPLSEEAKSSQLGALKGFGVRLEDNVGN
jgi:uncharacterized protein (TIGR03067 family)